MSIAVSLRILTFSGRCCKKRYWEVLRTRVLRWSQDTNTSSENPKNQDLIPETTLQILSFVTLPSVSTMVPPEVEPILITHGVNTASQHLPLKSHLVRQGILRLMVFPRRHGLYVILLDEICERRIRGIHIGTSRMYCRYASPNRSTSRHSSWREM